MAKNELVTKGTSAIALVENYDLQTIDSDLQEAIAEEMDGLGTIPLDRVKIPSGGGLAFELPGEDEDHPESSTELTGVILYHHPVNAYWAEKFNGGNEQPDCSSMDGKQGVVRESGEIRGCDNCPYNQFGSDGQGKACKNIHRIYILREGNPVPLILALPPTSLKPFRDYIGKRILLKGLRSYEAVTRITLKKEKNSAGINYSRAVFEFKGKLADDQIAAATAMATAVKATDKAMEVIEDDYVQPTDGPRADADGFINVPEDVPEDLPFK